uniref:Uncharacterized protein n=1 Tax=Setaria viridis TaxID=4556 RepID=A0A4U6VMS0_SETVI|nr:hypothetical protein SEVIR_2G015850v2 [Setaria viridis]
MNTFLCVFLGTPFVVVGQGLDEQLLHQYSLNLWREAE